MARLGFTEVVITTAVPESLVGFFTGLGWGHESLQLTSQCQEYFALPSDVGIPSRLQHPSSECSVLLLPVPASVPPWRPPETELVVPGGLFDLNMRTNDSDFAQAFLREHAWTPFSEPIPWQFGDNSVKEFLSVQSDGVVLAVMERVSPPLPGPPFDRMSDIFNATQIVQDHDRTLAFLSVLGFGTFIDFTGPLPGEGPRVLNLQDQPDEVGHIRLTISHPEALMQGSIEVITTPNIDRPTLRPAHPHQRGLTALRIPCDDVRRLVDRLTESPWADALVKPLMVRDLGFGAQECCSVLTPDGARLDLFQRG